MRENQLLVSAGIIRKGGKILLAKRKSDSLLEANKWELPGGKVEFQETPEAALAREIKEELGITIKVGSIHAVVSHNNQNGEEAYHIILLVYLADYVSGEVQNLDVQDSKWVSKSDLAALDFVKADEPVIKGYKF